VAGTRALALLSHLDAPTCLALIGSDSPPVTKIIFSLGQISALLSLFRETEGYPEKQQACSSI